MSAEQALETVNQGESGAQGIALCLNKHGNSPGLRSAEAKGDKVIARCRKNRDSSPSLQIYECSDLGNIWVYKCFSCGAHGTLVQLLAEDAGISIHKARQILAKYIGANSAQGRFEPSVKSADRNPILLDHIAEYCHTVAWEDSTLHNRFMNKQLSYLESRTSLRQIRRLSIGVGPYQAVYGEGARKALGEIYSEDLVLVAKSHLRRISGRVVFPIHDTHRNVTALFTRAIGKEKIRYKCIGSKGGGLFGLPAAADAIVQARCAIVVEGPFDVASIRELSGQCREHVFDGDKEMIGPLDHIVACMGSLPSKAQLETLRSLTDTLIMVRDGDKANDIEGLLSFAKHAAELGFSATITVVPKQMDPDEYVTHLRDSGMQPKEILEALTNELLKPASDWIAQLVAQIVRMQPARDQEFWRYISSVATISQEKDKVISAAAEVLDMPVEEIRTAYEDSARCLRQRMLFDAHRNADDLHYFKVGRSDLEDILLRCSPTEIRVWLTMKAEAAKSKSVNGVFPITGTTLAWNCKLTWRQVRTVMQSLKSKGMVQYDKLSEVNPFEVSLKQTSISSYIAVPFDFVWKRHAARVGTALPTLLTLKSAAMPKTPLARIRIDTIADRTGRRSFLVRDDIKKLMSLGHVDERQESGKSVFLVSLMPIESEDFRMACGHNIQAEQG